MALYSLVHTVLNYFGAFSPHFLFHYIHFILFSASLFQAPTHTLIWPENIPNFSIIKVNYTHFRNSSMTRKAESKESNGTHPFTGMPTGTASFFSFFLLSCCKALWSHSFLFNTARWKFCIWLQIPWLLISKFRKSTLNIHWKDWCWRWGSDTLATWCEQLTHQKRPRS